MKKQRAGQGTPTPQGYTLVELMITVAIISILAAISIPKFGNLTVKAREGTAKGTLSALRSGIAIYYADNEGIFPMNGAALVPKYMDPLPEINIPPPANHFRANAFVNSVDDWATGAWVYASANGHVAINCTHADSKGSTWSLY